MFWYTGPYFSYFYPQTETHVDGSAIHQHHQQYLLCEFLLSEANHFYETSLLFHLSVNF